MSSNPKDAVSGAVSGSMEWAAVPASRARAESVVKPLATWRTEGTPARAKRASASGSLRHAAHRGEHVGHNPVEPLHQRCHQLLVVGGVAPEVRGRLLDVAEQGGRPARAEGVGESQLGLAQTMPSPARLSERKNGEATREGWTAEHTS